jgi:hypothetical protein
MSSKTAKRNVRGMNIRPDLIEARARRCYGCGYRVVMPCRICDAREQRKKRKTARELAIAAELNRPANR